MKEKGKNIYNNEFQEEGLKRNNVLSNGIYSVHEYNHSDNRAMDVEHN